MGEWRIWSLFLAMAVAVVTVSPTAILAAPLKTEQSRKYLNQDEINSILVGNTIRFAPKDKGIIYIFFEAAGTSIIAHAKTPGRIWEKKWWIEGEDTLCRATGKENQPYCQRIATSGDATLKFFSKGGKLLFLAALLKGRQLPETEEARKAREAEIARLREKAEISRLTAALEKSGNTVPAGAPTVPKGLGQIAFGTYHGLIIGINDYTHLPKLKTAITDSKAVANMLEKGYGFKVTLLINPDRRRIIDTFDDYREKLGPKDNLLIYYAGHGWLDEEVDQGYWLPVDAKPRRRSGWISNATLTDTLKGLSAKHVMVVADSCYSGTLVRSADMGVRKRTGNYWKTMAEKWTRVAITSGGLEPVADKGGGDYSPFAKAFIDALRGNATIMDGMTLFSKMRRPVMLATEQTPQFSDVRQAGHDGGDFLFVRKK